MEALAAGLILAGGRARRLGGLDKALLPLAGKPLLAHVLARLRPQVERIALSANGDPNRFSAFDLPILADRTPDFEGPLAGLAQGLAWASSQGYAFLLTVPVDCPFLPADLAQRLALAIDRDRSSAAIALSAGRLHPVIGLFSVVLQEELDRHLRQSGDRKVETWLQAQKPCLVPFPDHPIDPFFNINSPEDRRIAETWLARDFQD